jgi:hypothetical protein
VVRGAGASPGWADRPQKEQGKAKGGPSGLEPPSVSQRADKNIEAQCKQKSPHGRPAGFGQNEKEEEEPKVRQNKGVFLGVCSKTRFLTKIDNCKNYIGKSIDTIYTKPRLICQWHLKLFCIRKSFMRDLIV